MTKFKRDPFDYSKQIARGAAFLDRFKPGWDIETINDARLDLGSVNACVLGQTFSGHYAQGKAVLRASLPWYSKLFQDENDIAIRYGFQISPSRSVHLRSYAFSRLTEQWIDFMHARRNAVLLPGMEIDEVSEFHAHETERSR